MASTEDETQDRLSSLDEVISEGVSEIRDGEKTVKYRPLSELNEIKAGLQRKKSGRRRRTVLNPTIDHGID